MDPTLLTLRQALADLEAAIDTLSTAAEEIQRRITTLHGKRGELQGAIVAFLANSPKETHDMVKSFGECNLHGTTADPCGGCDDFHCYMAKERP